MGWLDYWDAFGVPVNLHFKQKSQNALSKYFQNKIENKIIKS